MRKGFYTSGIMVVDKIKFIGSYPDEGMLTMIDSMQFSGGGIFNATVDFKVMAPQLPVYTMGLVGDDSDGEYVISALIEKGIDASAIRKISGEKTSFTDVMTDRNNGRRTFFHYQGANSLLDIEDVLSAENDAKIFHCSYLLALNKLDSEDSEYGVVAARMLKRLKEKGYKCSADVVSEKGDRYKKVIIPCLKYLDYFIINEIEAGKITDLEIRRKDNSIDNEALKKAAAKLLELGVTDCVIIHLPEAAYGINSKGETQYIKSVKINEKEIAGTVGAGDAFCAGALYGLHEDLPLKNVIQIANVSAWYNLFSPTATGGAVSYEVISKKLNEYYGG